jgi:hypothetical protein
VNPALPILDFGCVRYRTSLSIAACADRFRRAKTGVEQGKPQQDLQHCRECELGAAHAAGDKPRAPRPSMKKRRAPSLVVRVDLPRVDLKQVAAAMPGASIADVRARATRVQQQWQAITPPRKEEITMEKKCSNCLKPNERLPASGVCRKCANAKGSKTAKPKSKRAIAAKDPAPGLDGRHALVPRDTTTPELSWIGLNALLVETKEIAARRVAAIEKQIAAVESENDGVAKRAKALARSIAEN